MNRRLYLRAILILAVGGAVLAAVLGGVYLTRDQGSRVAVSAPGGKSFAEPGSVPIGGPFTLVDHTGRTVTDEDFGGKYLLVFFGFSNCPDVCPTTLSDIASALELLGDDANTVQPLFVSLDPERDTPERLAEYVAAFHPKIVGLTGTAEQIAAVAKEYRAFYEKVSAASYYGQDAGDAAGKSAPGDNYLISHQGNTYLMSPNSEYLTHFTYGTKPEEMAKTVRKAIAKFGNPAAEK